MVLMFAFRIRGKPVCVLYLCISPSCRIYRACVQRTSVCSLLTGALLEATAALGARSSLPNPFPQGSNSHAVLKGECSAGVWVFDSAKVFTFKIKVTRGEIQWSARKAGSLGCQSVGFWEEKCSHYSPVVCFAILHLSHCPFPTWFFYPQWADPVSLPFLLTLYFIS